MTRAQVEVECTDCHGVGRQLLVCGCHTPDACDTCGGRGYLEPPDDSRNRGDE